MSSSESECEILAQIKSEPDFVDVDSEEEREKEPELNKTIGLPSRSVHFDFDRNTFHPPSIRSILKNRNGPSNSENDVSSRRAMSIPNIPSLTAEAPSDAFMHNSHPQQMFPPPYYPYQPFHHPAPFWPVMPPFSASTPNMISSPPPASSCSCRCFHSSYPPYGYPQLPQMPLNPHYPYQQQQQQHHHHHPHHQPIQKTPERSSQSSTENRIVKARKAISRRRISIYERGEESSSTDEENKDNKMKALEAIPSSSKETVSKARSRSKGRRPNPLPIEKAPTADKKDDSEEAVSTTTTSTDELLTTKPRSRSKSREPRSKSKIKLPSKTKLLPSSSLPSSSSKVETKEKQPEPAALSPVRRTKRR